MILTRPPRILLVNPPAALPCEPPAGLARLAGALRDNGVDSEVLDLNLVCMLGQFDEVGEANDRWGMRACKNRFRNLAVVRSPDLYRSSDRYRRVISDLGKVLSLAGRKSGCEVTLSDFKDPERSPLSSADLLQSAEQFASNHFFPQFSTILHERVERCRPDYVGISFSYLSQALSGFAVAGFIRRHYPSIGILAGGGLMTSWMNNPGWNNPFSGVIDQCIKGAGEAELLQILGSARDIRLGSYDYRDLPLDDYLAPGRILPYAASYGCYWKKCRFCPDFAENPCYLARSAAQAVGELNELVGNYRPALVHLLDNAISPALLRRLAVDGISAPWYGFVRFEKDLEDIDFCMALKGSGCAMLKLGLESGSQRVLDALDKGIRLERASTVLNNLRRCGIAAYVYLLFGTPAETEGDALMTLDFVRRHHQSITFFNLAIFNMPVCGQEAESVESRFSDGDLSLYCDFSHPCGWDRRRVRDFLHRRFRRDSLIRPIELRNPGAFGSSHAPFFSGIFSSR